MTIEQRASDTQRRTALGEFLRTRRARLSPTEIGFPEGGHRRTPGLRREEVAVAAGVSITWYTYLEQGRDIHVSHSVLESIADVLHLTQDERVHLFLLAEHSLQAPIDPLHETVSPVYQRVLDLLGESPAYITGRRTDILVWNTAARTVFGNFASLPDHERNLLWLLFTDTAFRQLFVDADGFAQEMLETFRATASRYLAVAWVAEFVDTLSLVSPEFRQSWAQHNVRGSRCAQRREIDHQIAGRLAFDLAGFQVGEDPDMRCCVYTALPESEVAMKLHDLMSVSLRPSGHEE